MGDNVTKRGITDPRPQEKFRAESSDDELDLHHGERRDHENDNAAEYLYNLCLDVLQHLCRQLHYKSTEIPTDVSRKNADDLRSQVQKLFLWGESFRGGQLDKALEQSVHSKVAIMGLLRDIGNIIAYDFGTLVDFQTPMEHHLPSNVGRDSSQETTEGRNETPYQQMARLRSLVDPERMQLVRATEKLAIRVQCLMEFAPILEHDLVLAEIDEVGTDEKLVEGPIEVVDDVPGNPKNQLNRLSPSDVSVIGVSEEKSANEPEVLDSPAGTVSKPADTGGTSPPKFKEPRTKASIHHVVNSMVDSTYDSMAGSMAGSTTGSMRDSRYRSIARSIGPQYARRSKADKIITVSKSDPRDPTHFEGKQLHKSQHPHPKRATAVPELNFYYVSGEGIDSAVIQHQTTKFLGPEATVISSEYKGERGYMIQSIRPFTGEMLDDLAELSKAYINENEERRVHKLPALTYAQHEKEQLRRDSIPQYSRNKDTLFDDSPYPLMRRGTSFQRRQPPSRYESSGSAAEEERQASPRSDSFTIPSASGPLNLFPPINFTKSRSAKSRPVQIFQPPTREYTGQPAPIFDGAVRSTKELATSTPSYYSDSQIHHNLYDAPRRRYEPSSLSNMSRLLPSPTLPPLAASSIRSIPPLSSSSSSSSSSCSSPSMEANRTVTVTANTTTPTTTTKGFPHDDNTAREKREGNRKKEERKSEDRYRGVISGRYRM